MINVHATKPLGIRQDLSNKHFDSYKTASGIDMNVIFSYSQFTCSHFYDLEYMLDYHSLYKPSKVADE